MRCRHHAFSHLAAAALALLAAPAASAQDPLDGLDAYVRSSMEAWRVPGLAIAVVRDDETIYAKGFGVREIGKPDPVTPDTLFAVASNTKAFTAALLGMLVDENKLSWDDRVVDHMPNFALHDPWVTREIRVSDLLCHRSGLATFGGDHQWIAQRTSPGQIIRRLRYLQPAGSFRYGYRYQNLMFLVAGQLWPAVAGGQSWHDAIETRIFEPLGMAASVTSVAAVRDRGAAPHEIRDGDVRVVAFDDVTAVAPAAAIVSSANDMVRWMRLNLGGGAFEGKQLLSPAVVRAMQTAHTPVPVSPGAAKRYGRVLSSYGLGWSLSNWGEHKTVGHGGGLSGMISLQTLVPGEKLGVIVLSNLAPSSLCRALTCRILDACLGRPARDWSAELLAQTRSYEKMAAQREERLQASRKTGTKPSLPLEAYTGKYENAFSGTAEVRLEDGALFFDYDPRHSGKLEHWQGDVFRVTWDDPIFDMPKRSFARFGVEDGAVAGVTVRFYHPNTFAKVTPHPGLADPKLATARAPERFRALFETTKGDFVIQCERRLSPNGVDRFYNLVEVGFFTDNAFFRVIPRFVTQFGIHGDPAISGVWKDALIPDDERLESNQRGWVAFANLEREDSRSTQLYVNLADNVSRHGKQIDPLTAGISLDALNYIPIGKVVEGMDVVDAIQPTGEGAEYGGKGPDQPRFYREGNAYLRAAFPDFDYIKRAMILPGAADLEPLGTSGAAERAPDATDGAAGGVKDGAPGADEAGDKKAGAKKQGAGEKKAGAKKQ